MKYLDWNDMSELNLIYRINKEILHPLGLAISRNPDTGFSEKILIADDGVWEYDDAIRPQLSDVEIAARIQAKMCMMNVVVFDLENPHSTSFNEIL